MKTTIFALLIAVGSLLSGCSTTFGTVAKGATAVVTSAGGVILANADTGIQFGVLKYIAGQQDQSAARREVVAIAQDFKSRADAGEFITAKQVQSRIMSYAMDKGDAAEQLLAFKLSKSIGKEIDAQIESGAVVESVSISVHRIADMVIEGATFAP